MMPLYVIKVKGTRGRGKTETGVEGKSDGVYGCTGVQTQMSFRNCAMFGIRGRDCMSNPVVQWVIAFLTDR